MKLYYSETAPFFVFARKAYSIPDEDPSLADLLPSENRADQVSYVPVSRQVENFIASGQAVTSLRQTTASVSSEREKTLHEAEDMELTAFDSNRYGIDLADASMEIKRLEEKAKKVQETNELLAKARGETLGASAPEPTE